MLVVMKVASMVVLWVESMDTSMVDLTVGSKVELMVASMGRWKGG